LLDDYFLVDNMPVNMCDAARTAMRVKIPQRFTTEQRPGALLPEAIWSASFVASHALINIISK
jgi:hypothetical protein